MGVAQGKKRSVFFIKNRVLVSSNLAPIFFDTALVLSNLAHDTIKNLEKTGGCWFFRPL